MSFEALKWAANELVRAALKPRHTDCTCHRAGVERQLLVCEDSDRDAAAAPARAPRAEAEQTGPVR